jgi:hypothetical protein
MSQVSELIKKQKRNMIWRSGTVTLESFEFGVQNHPAETFRRQKNDPQTELRHSNSSE